MADSGNTLAYPLEGPAASPVDPGKAAAPGQLLAKATVRWSL
jgi:hypothetical protein